MPGSHGRQSTSEYPWRGASYRQEGPSAQAAHEPSARTGSAGRDRCAAPSPSAQPVHPVHPAPGWPAGRSLSSWLWWSSLSWSPRAELPPGHTMRLTRPLR
jgi:hypothetical protein